ncbi:MAG TPA: CsbD family protein [Ktedonobacteraceae bacterium]|nr:CsbD family protein [Ktedonobacteraceae bacterium]
MSEDTQRNENRDSAANDRLAGDTTQAKGRAKESWGALTGNERLKAEGEKDQMAGTARARKGQWKERIKAWIDRF